MAKQRMPRQQRNALWSLAICAVPVALIYKSWGTSLPWWLYLGCWLFLAAMSNLAMGILDVIEGRRD